MLHLTVVSVAVISHISELFPGLLCRTAGGSAAASDPSYPETSQDLLQTFADALRDAHASDAQVRAFTSYCRLLFFALSQLHT